MTDSLHPKLACFLFLFLSSPFSFLPSSFLLSSLPSFHSFFLRAHQRQQVEWIGSNTSGCLKWPQTQSICCGFYLPAASWGLCNSCPFGCTPLEWTHSHSMFDHIYTSLTLQSQDLEAYCRPQNNEQNMKSSNISFSYKRETAHTLRAVLYETCICKIKYLQEHTDTSNCFSAEKVVW